MYTFGLVGTLLWFALMAIISTKESVIRKEIVLGKEETRFHPWFALLVIAPVIIWAGFRSGAGYVDTNAYIRMYAKIPTGISDLFHYITVVQTKDPGFSIYLAIIKKLFGSSYTPFLFISALIQGLAVTFFFRKYSSQFMISMFIFIASTEYFSWMFNGQRQFLAVAIALIAFRFLFEKKYIPYVLLILLASTIHLTAIILLPVAFIVNSRPWSIRVFIVLGIAIFALIATNQFTDFLNSSLQDTQYSDSVEYWQQEHFGGTNPIRVLVQIVPTVIAFVARRKLAENSNRLIDISINMSVVSTAIWLVSMVTSGIHIGRLPIYVSLFNNILLPYEIQILFNEKDQRIVKIAMVVLYLAYSYYQLHFAWHAI